MEEYLKLLEKGNMGMETALIDLGLQQVTRRRVSSVPHKSWPTMETDNRIFVREKGGPGC